MIAFKHILVATDFSEASESAVSTAIEMARAFQARLTLLHVWNVPNMGYAAALAWPMADMEEAARKTLDEGHARVLKLLPGTAAVLKVGREWERILETVKELDVDLIVMGTQGRRGLPRLMLGSVAEKVVRLAPVPVLTVHGPKDATR
jgi:nucleotide-binding universal stress UspA family protein